MTSIHKDTQYNIMINKESGEDISSCPDPTPFPSHEKLSPEKREAHAEVEEASQKEGGTLCFLRGIKKGSRECISRQAQASPAPTPCRN
jgi:hypothetical protein